MVLHVNVRELGELSSIYSEKGGEKKKASYEKYYSTYSTYFFMQIHTLWGVNATQFHWNRMQFFSFLSFFLFFFSTLFLSEKLDISAHVNNL